MRTLILGLLLSLVESRVGADEPSMHFEVQVHPEGGEGFTYNTTFNKTDVEVPLPTGLIKAKWRCVVKVTEKDTESMHAAQLMLCSDGIVTITGMAACSTNHASMDANQIGLHRSQAIGEPGSTYITQRCYTHIGVQANDLPTNHI